MQVATSRSQVCQRLRYMRVLAPVSALVLVLAQQVFEHTVLMGLPTFQHFMTQVVFYAVTVPVALWLLVNWMLERVEQPAAGEAGGRSDPLAGLTRREMEVGLWGPLFTPTICFSTNLAPS